MITKHGIPEDWIKSASYLIDVKANKIEKNRFNSTMEEILEKKDRLLLYEENKVTIFCSEEMREYFMDALEAYPNKNAFFTYVVSCDNKDFTYVGDNTWIKKENAYDYL